MRLIDADALLEKCNKDQTSLKFAVLTLILHYAPTIDAVEVVRCKDCQYHEWCIPKQGRTENDYCSRGKRREL